MSAKDEILGRIRTALVDVHEADPAVDVPVDWTYGRPTEHGGKVASAEEVLHVFCDRVADYKATVVRIPDDSEEAVGQALVDGVQKLGLPNVILPAGVPQGWRQALEAAGVPLVSDEPHLSNEQLNEAGGVVTACRVGAAESGTIMLDHDADQGRRALTLVPDAHLCVVRAEQVVSDIPEAVERLQPSVAKGLPITWISGPSATSDIELSRVEGVHGPRQLYVVVAG